MEDIQAEYEAMRAYLAGDCGCCEHSGNCDFLANLTFPEHTTDCRWEFSRSLVIEQEKLRKKEEKWQSGAI